MLRKGIGGKNYIVRSVQAANIPSDAELKKFVVQEFGSKVCGEAKNMDIGYFKGNKRVWIRMDSDYLEILGKLRSGHAITLWCECASGRKRALESDDSDCDGTPAISTSTRKSPKDCPSEEKNTHVQEIFEKLKAWHGGKYTRPQHRLWAEAIDVNQHSSYDEHSQVSFFFCYAGT